jgi:hypothetical protein
MVGPHTYHILHLTASKVHYVKGGKITAVDNSYPIAEGKSQLDTNNDDPVARGDQSRLSISRTSLTSSISQSREHPLTLRSLNSGEIPSPSGSIVGNKPTIDDFKIIEILNIGIKHNL